MVEFCMPSLGADMEKGVLVEWKVKPGDRVKRGDIIADVETEKGVIEVEVFVNGVVEQLLVKPGEAVPVGAVMAIIRADIPSGKEDALSAEAESHVEKNDEKESSLDQPPKPGPTYKACSIEKHRETHPLEQPSEAKPLMSDGDNRLKISPSARKLAAELAIDLTTVHGTGPEGAINRADIEEAAQTKKESKKTPAPPTEFQDKMRQAIAAAMARSNKDIPHYYLETRIDMSHALHWLEMENRKRSIKERLLPAVLMIKAVALALGDVPELNGYWIDGHQPREGVHIGFAISLRQGGLIAPAIHDADLKSLDELMEGLRDLIIRTRAGRLRSSEMTDATITMTNLGDLGVETVYGVIYPPQLALVGFGKIMEQPWAENGMLGIRQVLKATLAADHRATDGHKGARFLDAINQYLQEADKL